jgi:DNA-binding LacI/PurR family transcriptional regulator
MDIALQELLKRFLQDYSNGIFQVGQILPSPRTLAREYNVTFSTARNLYTKLAQKGLVKSIPRKGTMLCCVPDPDALATKDLIRNGLTTIGVLDYVHPNAFLNSTMTQLRTIDELCNQNKILSRFYNLHKKIDQIVTLDPIFITKEDIKTLNKQNSVGYIFINSAQICHKENWKQLKKLNAPVVIVNLGTPPIPGICTVVSDEIKSGMIATEYQLKLKHQKIAFLGYDLPAAWQDQRINGYRLAMDKQNLRPSVSWSHFFPYHDPENIMDDSTEAVFQ